MAKQRHDTHTADMFVVPVARAPLPGAYNIGTQLRGKLSQILKDSPLSRHEVAARMSDLIGVEITKDQLDSWTAESRSGWRFPVEYLPAFESVLQTNDLLSWLADIRGARIAIGREALEAEIGKIEQQREALAKRSREIKKILGGAR